MARSLTIKHEEHASTSWLLTGFLMIAVGWMLMSAFFGGSADAAPAPSATLGAPISGR